MGPANKERGRDVPASRARTAEVDRARAAVSAWVTSASTGLAASTWDGSLLDWLAEEDQR